MFENKYPYTDFHELNLDWFLKEFKALTDKVKELEEIVEALDPDSITINPELEGDEPLLTGIQVNDSKYKAPDETHILTGGVHPGSPEFAGIQIGDGTVYQPPQITANPVLQPNPEQLYGISIRHTQYKILPQVEMADAGKFLRVDFFGNWAALEVPAAEGSDF